MGDGGEEEAVGVAEEVVALVPTQWLSAVEEEVAEAAGDRLGVPSVSAEWRKTREREREFVCCLIGVPWIVTGNESLFFYSVTSSSIAP